MVTATRYIRVMPDERVAKPVDDRTVIALPEARTASVSSDGGYDAPIYVQVYIDAGDPTSVFVLIDGGGPTSTYVLIDGGDP